MNNVKKVTKFSRGFTLIELLVTIAIIGILASVVFPSLSGARERARDAERVTEVGQIALAIELYYNSCREYPATLATTANNGSTGTCSVTLGTFLPTIPEDPLSPARDYDYAVNITNTSFVIRAELETNNSALNNDLDGTVNGLDCDGLFFCKGG